MTYFYAQRRVFDPQGVSVMSMPGIGSRLWETRVIRYRQSLVHLYPGQNSATVHRLGKRRCRFQADPSHGDSSLRPEHKPSKLVSASRRRECSN
jgi:hypothetical protein